MYPKVYKYVTKIYENNFFDSMKVIFFENKRIISSTSFGVLSLPVANLCAHHHHTKPPCKLDFIGPDVFLWYIIIHIINLAKNWVLRKSKTRTKIAHECHIKKLCTCSSIGVSLIENAKIHLRRGSHMIVVNDLLHEHYVGSL